MVMEIRFLQKKINFLGKWKFVSFLSTFVQDVKAPLHGSPRLIKVVESTKVNRVNSSFQRK